tara:strand:+ start:602 stop:916 length:315 start_codon:yes stop_codon:yes gene_type:complete
MKITSKNLAIIMIMVFLIFNHFVGLAWEVVKTLVYIVLFMFLLKQISPDLYNYLMNIIDIKNFKISNIMELVKDISSKVTNLLPFFNKQEKCQKDNVEIESETK